MRILMVCLGNICRSPLAHGILQHKIEQLGLSWEVDSAGTANYHNGALPDQRSIEIAQKHGLDITNQRARQFVKEDFDQFDLIFVMDSSNYNNVMKLARTEKDIEKVHLIMNEVEPTNQSVPDPYYGTEDGFEKVYQMLNKATDLLIHRLRIS